MQFLSDVIRNTRMRATRRMVVMSGALFPCAAASGNAWAHAAWPHTSSEQRIAVCQKAGEAQQNSTQ